jgi:tetratricopeptide (TPR) repeat protein
LISRIDERRQTRLAVIAVALAAVLPYVHTLAHGFAYDDGVEVVDNAFIRTLDGVPRLLSSPVWEGAGKGSSAYRPLTTLTYALNHAVGGLAPFGYHLVNLLLHAAASVLVVVLATSLGLPLAAATLAGLLFAVHPVHVEAVANVAGRKELLVTVLATSAVLLHGGALRRGGWGLVGAPLAATAAAFTKETGLVVIGVVVVRDLLVGREDRRAAPRRAAVLYASYLAGAVLYLGARWMVLRSLGMPGTPFLENPIASAPVLERVATALVVLAKGLVLLIAPVTLSPDYSYAAIPPVVSVLDPRLLAALAGLAVAVAIAAWPGEHRALRVAALAWYGLTIFPGSNLLVPIGTLFGERLLYLPSVGFALVVVTLVARWLQGPRRSAALAVAALALCLLAIRGAWYARAWADDYSIFSEGVRVQPASAQMQLTYGGQLLERGELVAAGAAFARAAEILEGHPSDQSPALVQLGVTQEQLGRPEEAERLYARVLEAEPTNADALWRVGVLRWARGDRGAAVKIWEEVVAANPRHAPALADLGLAAYLAGDLGSAEARLREAAASGPNLPGVWYKLGLVLERRGEKEQARAAWHRFLELAPGPSRERDDVERRLHGNLP